MKTHFSSHPASRLAKNLNIPMKTALQLQSLIKGRLDPAQFDSVRSWLKDCHHEPARIEQILVAANDLLDGFGIEVIRSTKVWDRFWCDARFVFINMDDVYAPTLMFNTASQSFIVSPMADIADRLASSGELAS